MRIVVAIYEPSFWTLPDDEVRRLAALLPDDEIVHVRSAGEQRAALADADVLFGTRLTVDDFAGAAKLRWVHSSAVGIGGMLFPSFVASPVLLTNSRGLHAEPIAEHAIALLLALRRSIHVAVRRQVEHAWAQDEIYRRPSGPLTNVSLLVVGLGEIGSRIAELALRLGMNVSAVRKRVGEPAPHGLAKVRPAEQMCDALAEADAVILAAPHTNSAKHMIGEAEIASMKRGSLLINVSRGKLIDDVALVAAMRDGQIGGAALDAFEREPLPADHVFWDLPNLLITPHTAAFGQDYWRPAVDLFVENLRQFRSRGSLTNVVDKSRGY